MAAEWSKARRWRGIRLRWEGDPLQIGVLGKISERILEAEVPTFVIRFEAKKQFRDREEWCIEYFKT